MAIGYLTLDKNSAGALSSWSGYESGYGEIRYTTPTTDTEQVTVSIPAEMSGATFNSATLTYTLSSDSGTRKVQFAGGGGDVTNAKLLEKLLEGQSFGINFSFRASGGTGGEGSHSAVCMWKNIAIAVDYTPATGLTGSATIANAGSVIYSLEKASLAYGESITFGLTVRPTVAVTKVTTVLYPGALSPGITLATDRSISANGAASLSYALSISAEVYAAMTQRAYDAQIEITLTGANGTSYTTGRVSCEDSGSGQKFRLLRVRNAPVISGVSWGESGTSHISAYGNPIAGRTVPTVSFSVALDTDADSGIGYESRTIALGGRSYTLSANSGTLEAVSSSGSVDYTIAVTDSYGQVGTLSGTITVLAYTQPTLRNVAINRYIATVNSQGQTVYELDDDGDKLWFDAEIAVQTALGSGTNMWSLSITPSGGSAISVVSGSSLASKTYTHDRTVLTGTYANTSAFTFTVELSDAFTIVTYQVTVPKAGGIFNIETTGVAVGMRSTGTEITPLFQSAYPAHFYNGVYGADGSRLDEVHDTGWVALTLESLFLQASGWATCAVRLKDGIVYVRGAVTIKNSMGSSGTVFKQITTLPEGFRPPQNMLVNSGARSNYTSVEIDADGAVKFWNRQGAAVGTSEVISICATFPVD